MSTIAAAIQMCSSHDVDENLATAKRLIKQAAAGGAKLIVLPEMFAVMGLGQHDKILVKEKLGEGKIQHFLADEARENEVWIVGGTIPIESTEANKIKAACLVFDDQGNLRAHYNKMHLFDVTLSATEFYNESDTTVPGEKPVVVDTPFGKLGLAVCYDVRFPELFRCLFNEGAEIIILPAAFTVKTGKAHWEILARSRAIENFCYLIGACQGGTHASGRQTYGHSFIVAPWGNVLAEINDTREGIALTSINLDEVYLARKAIPIDKHQRIFCYPAT